MTRAALLCATLLLAASPLVGQAASVLVGGVTARYADSVSGSAAVVSGRLSASSATVAGAGHLGFSQFVTGEWAIQAAGQGTFLKPVGRYLAVGAMANGAANDFEGGSWSGTGLVGPLVVGATGHWVGTLRTAVGAVRAVDESGSAAGAADLRVRYGLPDDRWLHAGLAAAVADTIAYVDLTAGFAMDRGRLSWSATAGVRAGDLSDEPWVQALVEYAPGPWTVLEASAGRYPRDLVGFTDGLYVSLGLRVNLTRAARSDLAPRPPRGVDVEPVGPGRVRMNLRYRTNVERLEVAGDWNDWEPVPLRRLDGGRWVIELSLEPGVHKYALVVDGDEWVVPDDVATVPDDFGGRVALMIVR